MVVEGWWRRDSERWDMLRLPLTKAGFPPLPLAASLWPPFSCGWRRSCPQRGGWFYLR
jgi:hypothetical protein